MFFEKFVRNYITLILILFFLAGCITPLNDFDLNQTNIGINLPDDGSDTADESGSPNSSTDGTGSVQGGTDNGYGGSARGNGESSRSNSSGTSNGTGTPSAGNGTGTPSAGNGTETTGVNEGTVPGMNKDQAKQYIEMILSNPYTTVRSLTSALEIAQLAGLANEEETIYQRLIQLVQTSIDTTLSNPNSSIRELLEATELSQQWGVGDNEIMEKIVPKIRSILQERLNGSHFCRHQLMKIAEFAQLLGLDDIAEQAQQKSGSNECVDFYLLREYTSDTENETMEATATGYFEELMPIGLVDPITRSYGIKDGKLVWSYNYINKQRCETITKTGGGTEQLNEAEGQLFTKQNGEFAVTFYKFAKVKVNVMPSGNPDCQGEEVQSQNYEEETNISTGIEDASSNPNYLHGEKTETEGGETTKRKWTIYPP